MWLVFLYLLWLLCTIQIDQCIHAAPMCDNFKGKTKKPQTLHQTWNKTCILLLTSRSRVSLPNVFVRFAWAFSNPDNPGAVLHWRLRRPLCLLYNSKVQTSLLLLWLNVLSSVFQKSSNSRLPSFQWLWRGIFGFQKGGWVRCGEFKPDSSSVF